MKVLDGVHQLLDFIRSRKRAYQLAFGSPAGRQVMEDLAKFCRANETCFHPDPRIHAALEGRREVWLRINKHLDLSPEQLAEIFSNGQVQLLKGNSDE